MIQEEVESQLSAMFDGELPAAQCELLSRRIARDERLRARWSRYALIGAAMRSEPVATARAGFAARVSAALGGSERRVHHWGRDAAVAASVMLAVAGLGIGWLRTGGLRGTTVVTNAAVPVPAAGAPSVPSAPMLLASARARPAEAPSYVTPVVRPGSVGAVQTELADYIVAHSEYSTPLMRHNLLSELVSESASVPVSEPSAPVAGADRRPAH